MQSGTPWVWLTGGAISASLLAVLSLLCFIGWQGLAYFWPTTVQQWQLDQNQGEQVVIGQRYDYQEVPSSLAARAGVLGDDPDNKVARILVKVANREFLPQDFVWIWQPHISSVSTPADLTVIERRHNGNLFGRVESLQFDGKRLEGAAAISALPSALAYAKGLTEQAIELQQTDIGLVNHQLEQLRLNTQHQTEVDRRQLARHQLKQQQLQQSYQTLEAQLFELRNQAKRDHLVLLLSDQQRVQVELDQVLNIYQPNAMTFAEKLSHWLVAMAEFVSSDPRESNSEGGVYPAIFGTVFMVLLMSVVVMPFGVLAAIYLHEYAGNNALTKLIRIAVINLAGVPSIVYGVFGLGFFVYGLGGSIDQLFYHNSLPSPTFGTPGVLWAALTLAMLTLPVVIVATEEGLSRIPASVRHGSYALGATKFETLWRTVLPMATPAMMTGLILAVARAAGEVAPLMLVGVVKLAPQLPVDGIFPFVHLERKFMHLGFHIYDVGFQSANVEAARPIVYATSLLLVLVIIGLNLTAIGVRNRLRGRYQHIESH